MPNNYSAEGEEMLKGGHPLLVKLLRRVLQGFDHSILYIYRGEKIQNEFYAKGTSKLKFPLSNHNFTKDGKPCSLAADICPYLSGRGRSLEPVEISYLMGYVRACAEELDTPIIWGADWDSDNDIKEHSFQDYCHIELDKKELIKRGLL